MLAIVRDRLPEPFGQLNCRLEAKKSPRFVGCERGVFFEELQAARGERRLSPCEGKYFLHAETAKANEFERQLGRFELATELPGDLINQLAR